jgi:5-(carboxyamino)imidazole ribonucleotide mutase
MSVAPRVGIIMGSTSDLETMRAAATTLQELGIPFEMRVVSAHRTPDLMFRYASEAKARGIEVIVAGAGGAAHLPGMVATKTDLPVIGVPIQSKALNGLDSLLSIAQMPAGVPVATMAIGGAANAALFAARILALHDPELARTLHERTARIAADVERIEL